MTFNNKRPLQLEAVLDFQTVITLDVAYIVFCRYLGPRLMRDRKPFSLKIPILIYNLAQIVMNAVMFSSCFSLLGIDVFNCWSNMCYPITAANIRPSADEQILFTYKWYYLNKLFDLLDTVFFVLRKKTSQITVHHVSHHASMVVCSHITAFHLKDEESNLKMIAVNSFVHVVMHAYYLISGLGPSFQKYLYLKKYVTMLQLVEIIMLVSILVVKLINCRSSPAFLVLWLTVILIQFGLFTNFCWNTYLKKTKDT